jgi:hypothetical protein
MINLPVSHVILFVLLKQYTNLKLEHQEYSLHSSFREEMTDREYELVDASIVVNVDTGLMNVLKRNLR